MPEVFRAYGTLTAPRLYIPFDGIEGKEHGISGESNDLDSSEFTLYPRGY